MNAYALTTVARVKSFMGITVSTYDSVFELLIDVVTDFIENECDRRFKKTAYTNVLLDGQGTRTLVVPQFPIVSSETVSLFERVSGSYGLDAWDAIASGDIRIDYESGIIKTDFNFLNGFENYKINYTAGYDFANTGSTLVTLASVGLSDLEFAVWKLVGRAFNQRKSGGDVSRMRLYNYDVTFSKEAYSDDEIKEVLSKYKRLSF